MKDFLETVVDWFFLILKLLGILTLFATVCGLVLGLGFAGLSWCGDKLVELSTDKVLTVEIVEKDVTGDEGLFSSESIYFAYKDEAGNKYSYRSYDENLYKYSEGDTCEIAIATDGDILEMK